MNTDDTDQEKANYYRGLARMGADQEIARIAKIAEIENRKRKRTERVDLMAVLLRWAFIVAPLRWAFIVAPLRCATACGARKKFFSLLTRHLPFSSQARLGTVPGYYQTSRCAGLDWKCVTGRVMPCYVWPWMRNRSLRKQSDVARRAVWHPTLKQKRRRMGHPRRSELKKKQERWATRQG